MGKRGPSTQITKEMLIAALEASRSIAEAAERLKVSRQRIFQLVRYHELELRLKVFSS